MSESTYQDVTSYRRKRFRIFENLIAPIIKEKGHVRILDVGGTRGYWDVANDELRKQISVVLLNFEEALADRRDGDSIDVEYRQGDGCNMPEFADGSFDVVHSNSVIEHVGSLQNMGRLADETRRVGNAYYVQAPYLWFPYEPHYRKFLLHWVPKPTRAHLVHRYKFGLRLDRDTSYKIALKRVDGVELVDQYLMRQLFPDGTLQKERVAIFTKSLIMTRSYRSV